MTRIWCPGSYWLASLPVIAYAGTWELEILVVPVQDTTLLYQTSFSATD